MPVDSAVNYLVAIDSSSNSKMAFYAALSHVQPTRDHLYLICVCNDLTSMLYGPYVPYEQFLSAQKNAEAACKKILNEYYREAQSCGVKPHLLLAISNETGDAICKAVEKKSIDFLFIGRRGMNGIKRFFMGSVSKYVVENANCNVMIIKEDHEKESRITQLAAEIKQKLQDSQHTGEAVEPDLISFADKKDEKKN